MHEAIVEDKPNGGGETTPTVARRVANYTLALLCVIALVNYMDRQVLSILLEEVKHDLGASDTQMGLLNGFVFSTVYIVAGIPIARWVDRSNRRNVLVACMTTWSAATILCGFTRNFWQLVVARMGVAAGEAGAAPSSQSMIADLYPREARGRAIGLWSSANSAGIGLGLMLGGLLSHYMDWRQVLMVVGLPGLLLAVLVHLTVKEPPRATGEAPLPPLVVTIRHLLGIRSFRMAILVVALGSFCGSGIFGWMPAFLIRIHGMSTATVGAATGIAAVIALFASQTGAGFLADRYGSKDARAYFFISAASVILTAPAVIAFAFVPSQTAAVILFFVLKLTLGAHLIPMYTVALSLAPSNMRGLAGFSIAIAINLAGAGLGPLFVGVMNDLLAPAFGKEAIRYSMALLAPTLLLAFVTALVAARSAQADFARHAPD